MIPIGQETISGGSRIIDKRSKSPVNPLKRPSDLWNDCFENNHFEGLKTAQKVFPRNLYFLITPASL